MPNWKNCWQINYNEKKIGNYVKVPLYTNYKTIPNLKCGLNYQVGSVRRKKFSTKPQCLLERNLRKHKFLTSSLTINCVKVQSTTYEVWSDLYPIWNLCLLEERKLWKEEKLSYNPKVKTSSGFIKINWMKHKIYTNKSYTEKIAQFISSLFQTSQNNVKH